MIRKLKKFDRFSLWTPISLKNNIHKSFNKDVPRISSFSQPGIDNNEFKMITIEVLSEIFDINNELFVVSEGWDIE